MNATDVMQKGLVFVSPELGLDRFEELLTGEEISGAPVLDSSGELIGVASKTDIVRALCDEAVSRSDSGMDLGSELTVGDIMSADVVTVGPEEDIKTVARRMVEGHLHRIFVVDGDEVLGIITSLDLVKLLV